MHPPSRTVEALIGRLAWSAHGVVMRQQLLQAGVTRDQIRHRLGSGALLREHPGVYRVGHRAPLLEAHYLGAVRACGEGALLSGQAATHLFSLLRGAAPAPEVTAPTQRRVAGVRTRRSPLICTAHATSWRGVPVTTVACTLVDIAAAVEVDRLARACHEAGVRFGTTSRQVEAVLTHRSNAAGAANLRTVLRGEVRVTLSALERRFLDRLRDAGLPLP